MILKIIIYIIIILILILAFVSYVIFKRPMMFSIAVLYFRIKKFNNIFKEGIFEKIYSETKDNPEKIFPDVKTVCKLNSYKINNNFVYELIPKKKYKKEIIYLHGGAFFYEITKWHVQFLDKLANLGKYKITIPCYDVITKSYYQDSYNLLDKLYGKFKSEKRKFTFMGDSAGGGLCISYTQYLLKNKKDIPDSIVLLSPWLDITMSNKNIKKIAKKDPVLDLYALKIISKKWANSISEKDYKVSPIYGELNQLPRLFVIYGDRELCYPDITLLKEKINNNKKNIFRLYKGLTHVFPLYPLPDIFKIKKQIIKFINENEDKL